MSKLWEDVRGELLGAATEQYGANGVVRITQHQHGRRATSIPLRCLNTRVNPRAKRTPIPELLRWEVWERDDFTCQECGARRRLTVDHIFAVALGGETVAANLQTLCKSCNSRKHTKVVL